MTWTRRTTITGLGAAALTAAIGGKAVAQIPDQFRKQFEESYAKALAQFPFKLIKAPGKDALTKWQELKSAGGGVPVILGDADPQNFSRLLDPFDPQWPEKYSAEEVLTTASQITFPGDWIAKTESDKRRATEEFERELRENPGMPLPSITEVDTQGNRHILSRDEVIAELRASENHQAPLGDWPDKASTSAGLSVVTDILSGKDLDEIYLVALPTSNITAIPAYMHWGNWNANPAAEWHVAALRSWGERYGAELIGLNADTMNIRVTRKPATREEALSLAREHYTYCPDIVDQGVGTLNQLAKDLMENEWWFFWWD